MASPLRIISIKNVPYRVDSVAYVTDDGTSRIVNFFAGHVETSTSLSALQALIPELITLTSLDGTTLYVNAIGLRSIIPISPGNTKLIFNTTYSLTISEDADTVKTAINNVLNSGGAIGGTIADTQVAFGTSVDTISGDAAFTYNSTDDVLTTEGHVLTPQATNPETTNPLNNLWINSENGHLYRGNRDTESIVHFNVRNDEGVTIPLGAPLYSKGEIGGSNRIKVGIADASNSTKMPAIGIAMEELNTTSTKDGNAIVSGILNEDINSFSGLTDNKVLYVAAHGGTWTTVSDLLTPTKPTGATHLIQNVGICIRHTGGITMKGFNVAAVGRTNDTPNEINITGSITAAAFVTSGGTATQYVRGNGSATELEILQDLSPQLGAALDTQGNSITGNYATDGRRAILIEAGTTRVLAESDAGDFIITENASPTTVTIPDSATTAFTIGTEVDLLQKGAGVLTISASGASVKLNGSPGASVAVTAQWGGVSIKKIDADEWIAVGKI